MRERAKKAETEAPFNQTKVELKCVIGRSTIAETGLLIRPKWN